jgi:hypothetical protein
MRYIKNTKLPKLFCEEGTNLISIKEIVLDNGVIIPVGTKSQVEDIIGYGFDIVVYSGTGNQWIDVRIINSQMNEYFSICDNKGIEF